MLVLKLETDPRWADIASKSIEEILIDHAYCEQKAATNGISLIIKFPEREKLVEVCTQIVAEEWSHFERVLEKLKNRGFKLGPKRPDKYVVELNKLERKGGQIERQLMDKLLISALIEARSCERFKLLSQQVADDDLKKFYFELMVSEAGHYSTFLNLAKEYMHEEVVKSRWEEMLIAETKIIKNLEIRPDRVH